MRSCEFIGISNGKIKWKQKTDKIHIKKYHSQVGHRNGLKHECMRKGEVILCKKCIYGGSTLPFIFLFYLNSECALQCFMVNIYFFTLYFLKGATRV